MPAAHLRVAGQDFRLECAEAERRRIEDLAAALETRLAGLGGETGAMRQLVCVALSLLDEAQASAAALVRARGEIERLSDILAEQRLHARLTPEFLEARGKVNALARWRAP